MNPAAVAAAILARAPAPRQRRAPHGQWRGPALTVVTLVEEGWSVSSAIRRVIRDLNLHPAEQAFRGIRAHYYTRLYTRPTPP